MEGGTEAATHIPNRHGEATFMGMRINTNIDALDAQRNLSATGLAYSQSVQKLSSGLRINSAADDAAGLSISEKLKAQINGLTQASRNAQDGISMIQTGEGALNEVTSMLQRMRELMVQAGNDTLSASDRGAITAELGQLGSEIDGISSRTTFNGLHLLNGNLATTQNTGAANSLTDGFSNVAGGGGNTTSVTVSNINVSNANASDNYVISANGSKITLTNSAGTLAQTIDLNGLFNPAATGNTAQVNFDKMGVSFTLTAGAVAGTAATDADVATLLATAGNAHIATNAGSASATYQIGADSGATQQLQVAFAAMDANSLGLGAAAAGAVTAAGASGTANAYLSTLDTAIQDVSNQRGVLGASQNRLQHTISNLGVATENITASESRIVDVDMASEMVNFTKTGILQQAGQAILAQANQAPSGILSLLRG